MITANTAQAATTAVEKIAVNIALSDNDSILAPLLAKRMQASVLTIADNVLSGRSIASVKKDKQYYEKLIHEVFDRILLGYTVKSVAIAAGGETTIDVVVMPWQDTIRQLDVQVTFEQMPESIIALAQQDISGLQQVFEQVLQGLPIDAVEWTRIVLKTQLQEFLNVHLPEFRGELDIAAGQTTQLHIYLYPKDVVIRDVEVSLNSETIPNVVLYGYRIALQEKAETLVGLPAAFVKRHEGYFSQWLQTELGQDSLLRALAAETNVTLTAGAKTNISIEANSRRYLIYLEGYLDVGRQNDNTSFKLHAGKYISLRDELFLEADFYPNKVKWAFMPGVSRKLTKNLTVGFKYDLAERDSILWLRQQVGKRWLLRLEHVPDKEFKEFSIRYKVHDFIGLEYTITNDDRWLRLVGNF